MENQAPQNGTVTPVPSENKPDQKIVRTYDKQLFPTQLRVYEYGLSQELIDSFLELVNSNPEQDLMSVDHPSVVDPLGIRPTRRPVTGLVEPKDGECLQRMLDP